MVHRVGYVRRERGSRDRDRERDRGPDPRRGGKPKKAPPDPRTRKKAEELHEQGMPFQMAMAVALGRVPLNEALERLARQERVNKLMEKHDLSRALATQIALGHADLEAVLARRRLADHRESHRLKSCLEDARRTQEPIALALHGKREGVYLVDSIDTYEFTVRQLGKGDAPGEPEVVHKLQAKFAMDPELRRKIRKAIRTDDGLKDGPLSPIERPQDRYTCSDKRLFRYLDSHATVEATLLEGEVLRGHITWFGRYEFGMKLRGDVEVTVFRHALHRLKEV